MNSLQPLIIVVVAAGIHASFQLAVSVQTLLGSHAIGARRRQSAVIRLTFGFAAGVVVMTALLLSLLAYTTSVVAQDVSNLFIWSVACGLLAGLALAVWAFYYRQGNGTALWVPRSLARHLSVRAKRAKSSTDAFHLGLTSTFSELLFIIAPLFVGALALISLPPSLQLVGLVLYVLVGTAPLLAVTLLVSGGHKISAIQRWREVNKGFLRFAAGAGLLVLSFYAYVDQVVSTTVYAAGGF